MHLLLIRHAQSQNNALPESQRVEDPAITELGERQAAALAEHFVDWGVDRLLTSAFRRALLTAGALHQTSRLVPHVWMELHEIGGCYAGHIVGQEQGRPGLNHEQVCDEFPGFTIEGEIPSTGWWGSRPYESMSEARRRAGQQTARLLSSFPSGQRVACVVHADFKALLLSELLGDRWTDLMHEPLYNTGVTELECSTDNGQPQVRITRFNDVAHLTTDLVSD